MTTGYARKGDRSETDAKKRALARKLRTLMDERGLSISDLARLMEGELTGERFNPVNLSHYKAGRSLPRPRYLNALSRVLGVQPQDLVPLDVSPSDGVPDELRAGEAQWFPHYLPSFRLEDVSSGMAWLQINQKLPWPIVLRILELLKGDRQTLGSDDGVTASISEKAVAGSRT